MSFPDNPIGWAIHLSNLLKVFQEHHGLVRFPVNVEDIAREYSKNVFPDEPITLIQGFDSKDFEGMLLPNPHKRGEWGILYNSAVKSKGRQNFTLAHELGHYLLHRNKFPDGKQCDNRDMMDWKSEAAQIEAQANTFASYILMPLDDFRIQTKDTEITLELMQELSARYGVSISAAILKWLSITDKRAMIVVGKDGYIDWAWSSEALRKSGVFYKPRQITTELPQKSLAAKRDETINNLQGVIHSGGVWIGGEDVKEMTIFTDDYNRLSISLLIYPDSKAYVQLEDDEEVFDTYSKFEAFNKAMNK